MAYKLSTSIPVHPLDVFNFILAEDKGGYACALAVVADTEGGGVRAPGAMMAISNSGRSAGYISNGCVDADVVLAAQACISNGGNKDVRYGVGSPFLDIRLPCGGRLDLRIASVRDTEIIDVAARTLGQRSDVTLGFPKENVPVIISDADRAKYGSDALVFTYVPKLRLRVVGRGVEPLYLCRIAMQADMDVVLQSPDEVCVDQARALDIPCAVITNAPDDDTWTAVVVLFHDHDLEPQYIKAALTTDAFYIGALGSRKTHAARCSILTDAGVDAEAIARIRGPIGLIPSQRHAPALAVSILAEITQEFQKLNRET